MTKTPKYGYTISSLISKADFLSYISNNPTLNSLYSTYNILDSEESFHQLLLDTSNDSLYQNNLFPLYDSYYFLISLLNTIITNKTYNSPYCLARSIYIDPDSCNCYHYTIDLTLLNKDIGLLFTTDKSSTLIPFTIKPLNSKPAKSIISDITTPKLLSSAI